MRIVEPPIIVEKGIGIYIPATSEIVNELLAIEIKHSSNNPSLSIVSCNYSEEKLWDSQFYSTMPGNLITYFGELKIGFYTITIVAPNLGTRSINHYGIIRPTNRLLIGLPYSAYAPPVLR